MSGSALHDRTDWIPSQGYISTSSRDNPVFRELFHLAGPLLFSAMIRPLCFSHRKGGHSTTSKITVSTIESDMELSKDLANRPSRQPLATPSHSLVPRALSRPSQFACQAKALLPGRLQASRFILNNGLNGLIATNYFQKWMDYCISQSRS
ncbi:uncharacterized protein MCYG_07690 [Microsporum canis CBS 113480]|uniref:Uncharacterized protein n=1 Tax=Arthroderma otae (strain ATCC MYA-4605 / CBS 113480) TaxID=554155 RepID=C5FX31_ARTOC|nr:uncharacterized protein MCYG_07690 [Microsporum canis CBS 113480]EEQ34871.1 predicted protein [Microsporum canis CBS 113480]